MPLDPGDSDRKPDADSAFFEGEGGCAGRGSCTVTIESDLRVDAIFRQETIFRQGQDLDLDHKEERRRHWQGHQLTCWNRLSRQLLRNLSVRTSLTLTAIPGRIPVLFSTVGRGAFP